MLQKANTNVIGTKSTPMNSWFFACGKYFLSKWLHGYFWKNVIQDLYYDMACHGVFAWGNQCK